jgi:site-specific recombinase XerC
MKPISLHEAKARSFTRLPAHITDELRRYDAYLHDARGLAAATRSNQLRIVGLFLRQNFERRAVDLRKLRPDNIRRFLSSQLGAGGSASYASQLACTLRSYLRYRVTCGDQVFKLSAVILNPVHWKLASLPRALAPEEVGYLLDTVARARRWPKRSYAIVRLALDMGLRSGEIAQLGEGHEVAATGRTTVADGNRAGAR